MNKKMYRGIVSTGIGIALLTTPLLASAQSLSDMMESLKTALMHLKTLQSQSQVGAVGQVFNANMTDDTPTGESSTGSCPALSITMKRGSRDVTTEGQVSALQIFLADYFDLNEEEIVTGYFGKITERTVISFQNKHGLPAYGIAGSLTRAKIAEVCGGRRTTAGPESRVTIVTPKENAVLQTGGVVTVSWRTTAADFDEYQIMVGNSYLNSARQLYDKVSEVGNFSPKQDRYDWTVPDLYADFAHSAIDDSGQIHRSFYLQVNLIKKDAAGGRVVGTSPMVPFSVPTSSQQPAVFSITPSSATNGTNVVVTGSGFSASNAVNLVSKEGVRYTIGSNIASTHNGTTLSFPVKFQSTLQSGSTYFVEVCNGAKCASSPVTFVPLAPKVTVTFPQWGNVLYNSPAGPIGTIKWTSSGLDNRTMGIALFYSAGTLNGQVAKYIAQNIPNTGSFVWEYDSSLESGTYTIDVYDFQVGISRGDTTGSSGPFTLNTVSGDERAALYDFGGMYGYGYDSTNGAVTYNNPATGAASCPSGYNATKLLDTSGKDYPLYYCSRPHSAGGSTLYDFGGMYGYGYNGGNVTYANPATGAASCRAGYTAAQAYFTNGLDYPVYYCYRAHTVGFTNINDFGGMGASAAVCPSGYTGTKVLGTANFDDPVYFCSKETTAAQRPAVFSITPSTATNGTNVVITGSGFGTLNTVNLVKDNASYTIGHNIPSSNNGSKLSFSVALPNTLQTGTYFVEVCNGAACASSPVTLVLDRAIPPAEGSYQGI